MLVMFGVGIGNPGWMAGLTVVMFAETIVPGEIASRRICQVVGVALFALAGVWLAHPIWLSFPAVS
jgi:predicted metal-binding membrane protein